jgi:hypothetical protein
MTTFEIILIVILIYLIIAHIINFICIADNCFICDFEDLVYNLLWIIFLPAAIIRRIIVTIKEKMLDK